MMLQSSRRICSLAFGALLLATAVANAQSYPNQTIKIIVPFPAGGGVDVLARILLPRLSEELKQPVIIENRGGAGGMLGATAVAQAAPDGYTLLLGTNSTHGTNPNVYTRLAYDPVRDFAPIALFATTPLLLVANPSLPAKSTKELIDQARGQPEKLNFASYGVGSVNHLGAELFSSMANIQVNHIPYRGSAPAMTDLIAGRVQYMLDSASTSLSYIQAGSIRLLGVAGPNRSLVFPDSPTISESDIPGFDATVWYSLFAPAGTPKDIISLLNDKVNIALASPSVKASFARLGFEAVGGSPDVLAQKVQAEIKKWANVVRDKKIQIDP